MKLLPILRIQCDEGIFVVPFQKFVIVFYHDDGRFVRIWYGSGKVDTVQSFMAARSKHERYWRVAFDEQSGTICASLEGGGHLHTTFKDAGILVDGTNCKLRMKMLTSIKVVDVKKGVKEVVYRNASGETPHRVKRFGIPEIGSPLSVFSGSSVTAHSKRLVQWRSENKEKQIAAKR